MQLIKLASLSAFAVVLAACGGDVKIDPTNVTNNDGQVVNQITNEEGCCTGSGGSGGTTDPDVEISVDGTSSTSGKITREDGSDFPAGTTFRVQTAPSNGFVFIDGSGNYTYRPKVGFTGTDSFTIQITEGDGTSTKVSFAPVSQAAGDVTTQTISVTVSLPTDASCASYTDENDDVQSGEFDSDGNCVYDADFASVGNPVLTDLTMPNIGAAAHIFEGSLFIGQNCTTDACLTDAGISEGGDGPTLTLEPGVTLAFETSADFMVINRGSQIDAQGTKADPITITSLTDILGTVDPEDVSQWGGMVIDGFGVTNKCDYTGTRGVDLARDGECHVASEGSEGDAANHYGGDNDADSSGIMTNFIVKHTGATVGNGDELNGITLSGVGSGTTMMNIQAYSTYDDGLEFFGGAVNVTNYIGLYVNDDSLDMDEGYMGTVTNALIIQSETNGNRCIEADGIGSYSDQDQATIDDFIARGLNSQPTIENLTCIYSPTELFDAVASPNGTGTHDPGQGFRLREALFPTITNALVTSAYLADSKLGDDDHNYAFRVTDAEGVASLLADDGDVNIMDSIFVAQDLTDGDGASSAMDQEDYLLANGSETYQSMELGEDPTSATNTNLIILDGFYSVALSDVVLNGQATSLNPSSGFVGAISADDDWSYGWAYGLHEGNRGQDLYFDTSSTVTTSAELNSGTSLTQALDSEITAAANDPVIATQPSNGYAYIDNGNFVYRPRIGFEGTDSFTIFANDAGGNVFQEVSVTVSLPSDASCASYTDGNGTVQRGDFDSDGNCIYDEDFAAVGKFIPNDETVTFENIGNAAHIFEGSLFVGENCTTDACLATAGISEGGDAATIILEPGVTLAFETSADFLVINRGSQIDAQGTKADPITITSLTDILGTVDPEDVSQWGGMVIDGFGVTNKCDYTGTRGVDLALDGECHVGSEGSEGDAANHYGGDNDADSSGIMTNFIVKHTGATVGNGDELNGITLSGVGSGTTMMNIQAYSTYDDGLEFFGGAVNVTNYIGLYVNDDSLDMDEGYMGTVTNALIIQSETNGNRCIEADGIGSYETQDQGTIDDFIARGLNSQPTIENLTCIYSATELFDAVNSPNGTGTHDPGQGFRLREALFPTITNALVTSAYTPDAKTGDDDHNYAFRVTDAEGVASLLADDGDVSITGSIFAAQDLTDGDGASTAQDQLDYLTANGNGTYQTLETGEDVDSAMLNILNGFYSVSYTDAIVDSIAADVTPEPSTGFVGAVSADDDWTEGWSYGLHNGNRGQALYFE